MASGNIKGWITVNGRHIPIMEGENKGQAIGRFFREKRIEKGRKIREHNENEMIRYNKERKKLDKELEYEIDRYKANGHHYVDYWEARVRVLKEHPELNERRQKLEDSVTFKEYNTPTITGRKKTSQEEQKLANRYKEHYEGALKDGNRKWANSAKKAYDDKLKDVENAKKYEGKYKLKEDTPKTETGEKRKITGVKKPYLNENPEYTAFARYKPKNEMQKVTDSDYRNKKSFRNDLKANEFDRISIKDRRDMYVMKNTNYTSVNQLKKVVKSMKDVEKKMGISMPKARGKYEEVLNKANKISLQKPKTFKDTTGKANKLVVKNAYEKYMKEHPNSKMKLSTFEKTYKRK